MIGVYIFVWDIYICRWKNNYDRDGDDKVVMAGSVC